MDVLQIIGAFWLSTWLMIMFRTFGIISRLVDTYEIALVQKFKGLPPQVTDMGFSVDSKNIFFAFTIGNLISLNLAGSPCVELLSSSGEFKPKSILISVPVSFRLGINSLLLGVKLIPDAGGKALHHK